MACLILPAFSLGQGVDLTLVDFFQNFSETQGDNGISYVGLPSDSGGSVAEFGFNAEVMMGNGTQTFEGPAFIAPGGTVISYVQQELSREFLALHPSSTSGASIQQTSVSVSTCVRNDRPTSGSINLAVLGRLDAPACRSNVRPSTESFSFADD